MNLPAAAPEQSPKPSAAPEVQPQARPEASAALPPPPVPRTEFIKLTEANAKDIWSTSVYSYALGGGGPGGGQENDRLRVGGWGDQYVALIQFDLPKVDCASKVVLELYNNNDSHAPTPMYLNVITAPWDWTRGDRLWWKDLPGASPWENRVLPAPGLNAWMSIDISDIFAKWCTGAMPNYGIMLKPVENSNNYDTFYSTRYAGADDLAPRLIITQ
ncbi:MAG TPA: DNRLRE domain-containing protein [Rhizomicrobium sp.]